MGWAEKGQRLRRLLTAKLRGGWTVEAWSEQAPKSLLVRTFRFFGDAHDYYYQLRQRADIVNVYGPNGEWLMHWSRYETED